MDSALFVLFVPMVVIIAVAIHYKINHKKLLESPKMKTFDEFLATCTPEQIAAADKEMQDACSELNHLPPIILVSRDPNDAKHIKKIKL